MKRNKNETQLSPEEELDLFIDVLNQERRPEESDDAEISKLQAIVRKVRRSRPVQEPSEEFTGNLHEELLSKFRPRPRKRFLPWTALAASILAIIFLLSPWSNTNKDIVLAMEQSIKQLQNYDGTLEKNSTNAAGERQTLQRTEIWSEGGNMQLAAKRSSFAFCT